MNICSEYLLLPTIFGLKYDEKLHGVFFSSNFHDMGPDVIPVVFGEIKIYFGYEKRLASIFGKATAARELW